MSNLDRLIVWLLLLFSLGVTVAVGWWVWNLIAGAGLTLQAVLS